MPPRSRNRNSSGLCLENVESAEYEVSNSHPFGSDSCWQYLGAVRRTEAIDYVETTDAVTTAGGLVSNKDTKKVLHKLASLYPDD